MRPRVLLFGGMLGTLATVLAAIAVFAPGVVEAAGPLAGLASALEEVDRRQLLLLASAVVGLFVSAVSWRATVVRPRRGRRLRRGDRRPAGVGHKRAPASNGERPRRRVRRRRRWQRQRGQSGS